MDLFRELKERGLIAQCNAAEGLEKLLADGKACMYTGFDPTADSLHVGHLVPLMGLARAQRAGHRVIALLGGGTSLIGDPSGKTEMRAMLSPQDIARNQERISGQIGLFLDLSKDSAVVLNNLSWLGRLNYLEMLRDIGVHFSVNRMLTADCFRSRMEKGLSFLEFNYMILQAYDFLELFRSRGCTVQLGGDDQWSNMLAGSELIRRVVDGEAFVLTYPLLTTSDGRKMGKTEKGAVWLAPEKTSPYEYFQYWRNVPDDRVETCLNYFTFLPAEETKRISAGDINAAKEVLAYESTALVHGAKAADGARTAARAAFSGEGDLDNIPGTVIAESECGEGLSVTELLRRSGMAPSNKEARRLIDGGGVYLDGGRVDDGDAVVSLERLRSGVELRKGKKHHQRIRLG